MSGSEAAVTELPPGCHSPLSEWPWREALPWARFSALRFDTGALCEADLDGWHLSLPDRLTTAAAKRRAEFLAGRLSARHALAELTGSLATPAQDAEQLPRWPAGTVGSITHSRGLAAAVVAGQEACRGIGLDAEVEMTAERARRLAPQILVASERAWFDHLPGERQGEFLTVAFSLKESLFKALYPLVRRRFYFPHARVTAWDADGGTVAIELLETLSPEWRAGARLTGQVAKIGDYLLTLIAISRES
ncbi:MAG: 4'-phosphopantetheinyl transferase superfamily protein [Salinicola sp.]|uniref:4'-phosphopantetheinyl transferase family protein n=1 Tax=Salinicola sp. TaxID=1978524 RepID=UPI001D8D56BE|nr:4'-phosphopantetheinyl transferase superfamily protein [Salinicola sp.]NRB57485.1 4'-phosphopantetheinyl transferase superfamily protein [Salinicola sp.]